MSDRFTALNIAKLFGIERHRQSLTTIGVFGKFRLVGGIAPQWAVGLDGGVSKILRRALARQRRRPGYLSKVGVGCGKHRQLQRLQRKIAGFMTSAPQTLGTAKHVHQRQQVDMVARPGGLPGHEGMAVLVDAGAHEQVEGIVHVVRRQTVFALRLGLDVVAVGVNGEA